MTYKIVRVSSLEEVSINNGKIVEVIETGHIVGGIPFAEILVEIDNTKEKKDE